MLNSVIFFIMLTLFVLVFVIRVSIVLDYSLKGLDDRGKGSVSIFGGRLKFDIKLPIEAGKEKQTEETWLYVLNDKIANIKEVYNIIDKIRMYLGKKIILKRLKIHIDFGLCDAFYTGLLTGIMWSGTGMLVSYVLNSFRTSRNLKPDVTIKPYFTENRIIAELYCIFTIKIVHIIVVGLKFLHYYLKKKNKGGVASV